jgi:hypothetical protein
VERQVGLARETPWPARSSAGLMVVRKARRSPGQEPVQGSGSRLEFARGVCGGSPETRRVTWLSHKTKTGGSAGGDRIRARREASMLVDTWRDRRACVGRTRTAATAWPCDEEECYMTYFPLRGLYHKLSARGSLVFCPARRDSYILTLGFLSYKKEYDLRVYGSFRGCVDLFLVARVIFEIFSLDFCARLVLSFLRCLGLDLLVGIMDSYLVHLCA